MEYNYIKMLEMRKMHGAHLAFRNFTIFYRYHLVMPSVPPRGPLMEDMVGGDYIRTPVVFRASDNCNIVGDATGNLIEILPLISKSNRRF